MRLGTEVVEALPQAKASAAQLWEFLRLSRPLRRADCIVVMGGHDTRVAERGAQLYLDGLAPWLLMSGGFGYFTRTTFQEPEACLFAKIAVELGVPEDRLLVESESSNSGENITFTRRLLERSRIVCERVVVVQKPYMERRALLSFRAQWPEVDAVPTSPLLAMDEYTNDQIPWEKLITEMVGQLHRLMVYPELGYTETCEIPIQVVQAAHFLVDLGFDGHLVPGYEGLLAD